MTKRYLGNIITQNPTAPAGDLANSAAKGVWSLEEQLAYQKTGLWPVPGNFPLDIPDVFSTTLYSGTGSTQTITNGIDLDGEGGMVWCKSRTTARYPTIVDTERGASGGGLFTAAALAADTNTGYISQFNSDGFQVGSYAATNENAQDFASWTWRKAPKFFDVLTYTGDNTTPRNISHNLGSVPGMIIIKCTETTDDWVVYHRGLDATNPEDYRITFNGNFARESGASQWAGTAPTSTEFTIGNAGNVNTSNKEYVVYLFAHNDNGDGGFGPDSDQDIIKCGSYTGTGSDGNFVNLGFEPQWVILKNTTAGSGDQWWMFDSMRGIAAQPVMSTVLFANLTSAELSGGSVGDNLIETLATGFNANSTSSAVNGSGQTYIYMAIRRGQLAVPEDATDVFDVETRTAVEPGYVSGFPVDMALRVNAKQNAHSTSIGTRLTGIYFANTDSTYQFQDGNEWQWDYMNGWSSSASNDTNSISWMWKRAPSFCDVVCWKTENTANRRLKHNLGVAPEMVWIKNRATEQWYVYQSDLGSNIQLRLDTNDDVATTSALWPSPSATEFGIRENAIWNTGTSLVGFFFATLAGISKVGSFTGNGSSQTIDCGFTAGSRFILIKRTDANGNWVFFDSVRGIVSGISPSLFLNDTEGERTYEDVVDPDSSGFVVNQETQQNLNVNGGNYIFYAIA